MNNYLVIINDEDSMQLEVSCRAETKADALTAVLNTDMRISRDRIDNITIVDKKNQMHVQR